MGIHPHEAAGKENSTVENAARIILVVDDMAINRLATACTLRNLGYEVEEAGSGQEALDKLKVGSFAVVLMNIEMPAMSGFECTEKIRAEEIGSGRNIPIIGFTSNSSAGIEQKCIDSGMNSYLDKAISDEQLDAAVKQLLPALISCKDDVQTQFGTTRL